MIRWRALLLSAALLSTTGATAQPPPPEEPPADDAVIPDERLTSAHDRFEEERFDEASALFTEVAEDAELPEDLRLEARFNAAVADERRGALKSAAAHYAIVGASTHPEAPTALERLATILQRTLRFEEAVDTWRSLAALQTPEDATTTRLRAARLAQLAGLDPPLDALLDTLLSQSPLPEGAADLALARLEDAPPERAQTLLERIQTRAPDAAPDALLIVARRARDAGDLEQAQRHWARVIKAEPESDAAAEAAYHLASLEVDAFEMPLTEASVPAYQKRFEAAQAEATALATRLKEIARRHPDSPYAYAAIVRAGELYRGFADALRHVQCPTGVEGDACATLQQQLSDAADQLDTRFTRVYLEQVYELTRSGIHNTWTARALHNLHALDPDAYPALPGAPDILRVRGGAPLGHHDTP